MVPLLYCVVNRKLYKERKLIYGCLELGGVVVVGGMNTAFCVVLEIL